MDTQGNTSIGDVAGRDIHKVSENVFLFIERSVQHQQQGPGQRILPDKFTTVGVPEFPDAQPIHEATLNQLYKLVVEHAPSQVLHLHGLPGTGKSTLVARLTRKTLTRKTNQEDSNQEDSARQIQERHSLV